MTKVEIPYFDECPHYPPAVQRVQEVLREKSLMCRTYGAGCCAKGVPSSELIHALRHSSSRVSRFGE